jgi:hypothetical protein
VRRKADGHGFRLNGDDAVSGPLAIIESEEDLTDLDVESVGRSHVVRVVARSGWQRQILTSLQPQPAPSPYRTLFPFILIVFACLLLVWRLVLAPSYSPAPAPAPTPVCPDNTEPYAIRDGDTCWALGQARGLSVDQVIRANPGLECTRLRPGQRVCLPLAVDRRAATTKTRARQ